MPSETITPTVTSDAERADGIVLKTLPKHGPEPAVVEDAPDQAVASQTPLDRATVLKIISAGYSFFCAGINDGSLGPIIPYLLQSYNIDTNYVSIWYAPDLSHWELAHIQIATASPFSAGSLPR